ncbi:MAG TPA: PfaD family polyunsaturated fatty acid/polyketide biosynthesis protein [Arenimonas sp.]|nr:PfaD family polyunsaturated fatty acid/polyketide biosynthesis protein [Arenimonas sp.]
MLRDPRDGRLGLGLDGALSSQGVANAWPVIASLPPLYPEWLGDRSFTETHGLRFAYVGGAMANGIASTAMVVELARTGCLGFFGAAGLSLGRVDAAISQLQHELGGSSLPWGVNLIHSPAEPSLEEAVAELLLTRDVRLVEASAFMALTPAIVRYAATGLYRDSAGRIQRRNRVFAKVSREEVARRFLEPMPIALLSELQQRGQLSALEVELAAQLPLAEDITVEADSGGHTDNRPLTALLPTIALLRDRISAEHGYSMPIRIGAAGGLGTPAAIAAAFALGAAYVQTGSVNQACVESGLGERARTMLAQAEMADVIMAPAADMFELGVDVQVLRRGSMFAVRARKLYELYRAYPSLEAIPASEREKVERDILRNSFEAAWQSTRSFWLGRDPAQVQRADSDGKHRMALVFRSYLGLASRWAIDGLGERAADFQIWCGPAMGAFNSWVRGSFLEAPEQRSVAQVARNLLEGAAVITRAQQLRTYGLPIPAAAFDFRPRPLA